MYEFLLTLHVLAAVIWVGGSAAVYVLGRRVLGRGDPEEMLAFSKEANAIGPMLYAPASIILLVAGIFLVDKAGYEFSQLWIGLALAGWVLTFLIGVGFYGPQGKRLDAIVDAEGSASPKVVANIRQTLMVGTVELLILLLVVVDMTTKPGL